MPASRIAQTLKLISVIHRSVALLGVKLSLTRSPLLVLTAEVWLLFFFDVPYDGGCVVFEILPADVWTAAKGFRKQHVVLGGCGDRL